MFYKINSKNIKKAFFWFPIEYVHFYFSFCFKLSGSFIVFCNVTVTLVWRFKTFRNLNLSREFLFRREWRRMSHWEKIKKIVFYLNFDLMAFIGLPLSRMSGCCSVERRITQNWYWLEHTNNSINTMAPICSLSMELH